MKKIPPFKLVGEPLNEEARNLPRFKWLAEEIGTRHQLGGEPKFLQHQLWPKCSSCGKEMSFYGQLDSISDEIMIGDAGLIYVFLCFDCYESKSIVHSH